MSRFICVTDLGATNMDSVVYAPVSGKGASTGPPGYRLVAKRHSLTTKGPNNPDEDWRRLRADLDSLRAEVGFDGFSGGVAARVDKQGVIRRGASLNWDGRRLGQMVTDTYGVPAITANDGAMFTAYELVFGALSSNGAHNGKSGLVLVPGTGIATCTFLWHEGKYLILPSEGQHNPYGDKPSTGCNCQQYCYESDGGGVYYERTGINPLLLNDPQDINQISPAQGALVASFVRALPTVVDLVVVAGKIPHKRRQLIEAIEWETTNALHGYLPTPTFILGSAEVAGTEGCLAYWHLANH